MVRSQCIWKLLDNGQHCSQYCSQNCSQYCLQYCAQYCSQYCLLTILPVHSLPISREVLILTLSILITLKGCVSWYTPRDGLMMRKWPYSMSIIHWLESGCIGCTVYKLYIPYDLTSVFETYLGLREFFGLSGGVQLDIIWCMYNIQLYNVQCTVISVIMPTPHFFRKYAPPFFDGSFFNILR